MRSLTFAVVPVVLGIAAASADVIRVPEDHPTIAAALGASVAGDTVRVACGLYEEGGLVLPGGVTLLGDSSDSSCTVLRSPGPGASILLPQPGAGEIRWLTFRDGDATFGSAIRGSPWVGIGAISNCRFEQNVASQSGGAIYALTSVRDCYFAGNRAQNGGAIHLFGVVDIADCVFVGNVATASGGALSASDGRVARCRFEQNTATFSGGAVHGAASVRDCEFVGNQARDGGGARLFDGVAADSRFIGNRAGERGGGLRIRDGEVEGCLFEENVALDAGGGVYLSVGAAAVIGCTFRADSAAFGGGLAAFGYTDPSDCVFRENHASQEGGGLYLYSVVDDDPIGPDTVFPLGCASSTFLGNRAGVRGGAIAQGRGFGTIRSCSIVGNAAPAAGGYWSSAGSRVEQCLISGSPAGSAVAAPSLASIPWVECSDFHGNAGGDWTTELAAYAGINGNFSGDPLLCADFAGHASVSSASPLLAEHNECGAHIGAGAAACETEGVVITTTPPGATMEVDGAPVVSPAVFQWAAGSLHTIGVPDSIHTAPGVRWVFQSWSDGGASTHGISAPSSPATVRATISKGYLLATSWSSGGTVTPATGWHPARVFVPVIAVPDSLYRPDGWVGTGLGSHTGGGGGINLLLRGPISEHCRFAYDGTYPVMMIAQGGGSVSPASGDYHVNDTIEIVASTPPGYAFDGWSGTGSGSYTGPNAVAAIQVLGPITETATFRSTGFANVIVQAWGNGTVTPESGVYTVDVPIGISAYDGPGHTFHSWYGEGPGSYTGPDRNASIRPLGPVTQTAYFTAGTFPFTISASPGGVVSPASGDRPAGSGLAIYATPMTGWRFREWHGTGPGSYSGPERNATVAMNGAITQHAVFEPDESRHGYEFSVSLSDTDPFATSGPPTGGVRPLHLWLTCSELGLSALEVGVQSTLPLTEFSAAPGVYNVGTGADLLLAVAECPTGEEVAHRLGSWMVLDTGGQVCLGPSAASGIFAAVDCGPQPSLWPEPLVRGFSSLSPTPCLTGFNGCESPVSLELSALQAAPGDRCVSLTWVTAAEADHAGYHVYRANGAGEPYERLTAEPHGSAPPHRFDDTTVDGDRTYHYKLGAVEADGSEQLFGPVMVTTPDWVPRVTALRGAVPNPFRDGTEVRFSLAQPGRARLVVYDVAGRRVAPLLDADLPAGDHVAEWDGRTSAGRAASGIYFVRFTAGTHRETGRIVHLGGTR